MFEKQMMIKTVLEQHFAKCWLGIDFDYREIIPERLAYILTRDVTTNECKLISRNYRKNDIVFLYTNTEIINDEDMMLNSNVKHLLYIDPFDVYLLPKDALLQLAYNN